MSVMKDLFRAEFAISKDNGCSSGFVSSESVKYIVIMKSPATDPSRFILILEI